MRRGSFRVYVVGGGTAVLAGWRSATIDADLCADRDETFRDMQGIKERLRLNVEFARPEDFVPALGGSGWVDARRFRDLVEAIPDSAYARHPKPSRRSVLDAVGDFLAGLPPTRPEG